MLPTNRTSRPILQFKDVAKTYRSERGSVTALDGLSIDVKEGEFLTIVGPSGCGKSTLLNILVGLELPSEGEIILDGAQAVDRKAVGYVMQNDNLYPVADAAGECRIPARARGCRRGRAARDQPSLSRKGPAAGFCRPLSL